MQVVIPQRYRDLFDRDIMEFEEILDVIDSLNDELTHLQEEFNDFKAHVRDNYKFVGVAEQIGYDERIW